MSSIPVHIPGFEILSLLGSGAMGSVYRARELKMDRTVALKVIDPAVAAEERFLSRFKKEVLAAGRFFHPNIVASYDAGEAGGYHYIAMEWVDGESLVALLKRHGRLPEREALSIALQVARALDYAHHAGVVHRDVKPGNVLLTRDGVAKLCDFGLAKVLDASVSITQTAGWAGTPWYMAPEQGGNETSPRADIYALGAMLYHLLVGEPPFAGPTAMAIMMKHVMEPRPRVRARRPEVSEATDDLVFHAMARDPHHRFGSARKMANAMEAALGLPQAPPPPRVSAHPTPTPRPAPKTGRALPRRGPSPLWALPVVALLLGVAGWIATRAPQEEARPAAPPSPLSARRAAVEPAAAEVDPAPAAADPIEEAFDILEAFRSEVAGERSQAREVIRRYDGFLAREDVRGTRWATEAGARLSAFRRAQEDAAAAALAPLWKEAERLAAEGKLEEAAVVLEGFPADFSFTEAAGFASSAAGKHRAAARKADPDRAIARADALAAEGKFDEAREILLAQASTADETGLARINARLATLETERNASVRKAAEEASEKAGKAYDDVLARLFPLCRDRKFAEARAEIDRARADPALAPKKAWIDADQADLALLEAAYGDALAGAKKLAAAGRTIELAQFGCAVTPAIEGERVVFRVEGATVPLSFDLLKRADVVALAGKVLDGAAPETHLKYGLVWFYGIPSKATAGDETARCARAEFEIAVRKDARAERYMHWIGEAVDAARIGAARRLLDEAKAAIAAERWTEGRDKLARLLESYWDLSLVHEKRAEIDAMLKTAGEKLEAERKSIQGLFAVAPKAATRDGAIDIAYDFASVDQLKDWEVWAYECGYGTPTGSWAVVDGEALGRGSQSLYWKPNLVGDFSFEGKLTVDEPRNAGVLACDGRDGKAYLAALGYDGTYGSSPRLAPKVDSTTLVRLDLARLKDAHISDLAALQRLLLEEVHKVLDGAAVPRLAAGRSYRVRLTRAGESISLVVDSKVVAQAKDATYRGGSIALYCNATPTDAKDVALSWDDVHIVGRLDPAWLSKALGK